jgi:polyferredoxin/formate hydrogenlyase subunit 6/NADH:ubiquinone oxidoreductase subunit I
MVTARKITQGVLLALFLALMLAASEPLTEKLPVNIFFLFDPLMAICVSAAARTFILGFLLAGVLLLVTVFLGRIFCGWMCPLGTTLDIFDAMMGRRNKRPGRDDNRLRPLKYVILVFVVTSSLLTVQVAGWLDPLCIAFRTWSLVVYPAVLRTICEKLKLIDVTSSGNAFTFMQTKMRLIDMNEVAFAGAWTVIAFFSILVLLQFYQRRFWCRNVCPLGALLGIFARLRFLRTMTGSSCNDCGVCAAQCRTGAISKHDSLAGECVQCFSCVKACPKGEVRAGVAGPSKQPEPTMASRRAFLLGMGAGLVAGPLLRGPSLRLISSYTGVVPLRPPGALRNGAEFLSRCARCGECMKVCVNNALHPAVGQAGAEGFWTPVFIPRIGACEYDCTLCGKVCPTGAIEKLDLERKQNWKIGVAVVDKSRCLPWSQDKACMTCEECCPRPEKAIRGIERGLPDGRTVREPYVVADLCTGCGACERKCPIAGSAAIRVFPLTAEQSGSNSPQGAGGSKGGRFKPKKKPEEKPPAKIQPLTPDTSIPIPKRCTTCDEPGRCPDCPNK